MRVPNINEASALVTAAPSSWILVNATKEPYHNGKKHNAHDVTIHQSFDDAVTKARNAGPGWGVGVVSTKANRLVCIDFDRIVPEGSTIRTRSDVPEWVEEWITALAPYVEVSDSGRGLHLFVLASDAGVSAWAEVPVRREFVGDLRDAAKPPKVGAFYANKYIAVTGDVLMSPARLSSGDVDRALRVLAKRHLETRGADPTGTLSDTDGTTTKKNMHQGQGDPAHNPRLQPYVDKVLNTVMSDGLREMGQASAGSLHDTRLRLGAKMGAAIGYAEYLGCTVAYSVDDLMNRLYEAKTPEAGKRKEYKAIRDAVEHGYDEGKAGRMSFPSNDNGATLADILAHPNGTALPSSTPATLAAMMTEEKNNMYQAEPASIDGLFRSAGQIAEDLETGAERIARCIIEAPGGEPFISAGTYVLGGRPKGMKSWLSLHVAASVDQGTPLFADSRYRVTQGAALYVDMQMSTAEALKRLTTVATSETLDYITASKWIEWLNATECAGDPARGLRRLVDVWLGRHKGGAMVPTLVVVDMVNDILPSSYARGVDVGQADHVFYTEWNRYARDNDIALLFVAHVTKGYKAAAHPTDAIYGSGKQQGAVDGSIALVTNDDGKTITMHPKVRGGMVDSVVLRFDGDLGHHVTDKTTAPQAIPWTALERHIHQTIASGVNTQGGIVKALEHTGYTGANIRKAMQRMERNGDLHRPARGVYEVRKA